MQIKFESKCEVQVTLHFLFIKLFESYGLI